MIINCFTDDNPLIRQSQRKVSVEEGLQIADRLIEELKVTPHGAGLAANQIGIDAAVAVVNVIKPRILINPVIKDRFGEFLMEGEGCLSYPDQYKKTQRYKNIVIHTEQEESDWYFYGENGGKNLLEAVCVQHEIDHLNGKIFLDRALTPIVKEIEIGRNDPCICGSGKKYMKCCI